MKDCTKEELENGLPEKDADVCIDFCLRQLYKDQSHTITEHVAGCCTYEELIGALLKAKDELASLRAQASDLENDLLGSGN